MLCCIHIARTCQIRPGAVTLLPYSKHGNLKKNKPCDIIALSLVNSTFECRNGTRTMNKAPSVIARARPRSLAIVTMLLLAWSVVWTAGHAQEIPTPTLDQVQSVARELYCPLCNGVRLDNCELQACEQMRQVISQRLAEGADKEQIKDEFVAQYGPVVLGEPPREGLNWLIWLLPVAAVIGGAAWLLITLRGWTRKPAAVRTPSTPGAPVQPAAPTADRDAYLARVEEDLERLG